MAWILSIDVAPGDADVVTDELWTMGTNGVAEVSGDDGPRLLAGFETEVNADAAQRHFGGTVAPIDPTQWAAPEATTVDAGGRTLTIDAQHSFGHGAHPTTRLCLDALERHLVSGQTVLDVGCGSGVLSLAAAALGASTVNAIDIDLEAIAATVSNASANDLDIDVSATPIEDVAGTFDLVVVNMLVAEIEPIAAAVRSASAGLIILSGALIEQANRWSVMFPGCAMVEETAEGEWAGRVISTHE